MLVPQLAVELVVDPKQIDVTIDDIGGLDDIMDRLVHPLSTCFTPVTCFV